MVEEGLGFYNNIDNVVGIQLSAQVRAVVVMLAENRTGE